MEPRLQIPLDKVFKRRQRKPIAGAGSIGDMLAEPGDVRRAIIFVHGFSGSPVQTWNQFQPVMNYDPRYFDADIFYYGYRSITRQTTSLANDLLYFLEAITEGAATDWLGEKGIDDPYGRHLKYEQLILVGHSLGGTILRKALLYADQKRAAWLSKCALALFAPAHCGARISRYASRMVRVFPGVNRFEGLLKFYIQPADELHPESPFVTRLRADTERLADIYTATAPSPFRARCVFGTEERIVVADHYASDERHPEQNRRNHTDICKPTHLWKWPLEYILPEGNP